MVTLQILNKVLQTNNPSIIIDNKLTNEYFPDYENEFDFIMGHLKKYKRVPDKETFLEMFPDFDLIEVNEPDRALLDTLEEEYLYSKLAVIITKSAELVKDNSLNAKAYLCSELKNLTLIKAATGTDIVAEAQNRLDIIKNKSEEGSGIIKTGFPELDELIYGIEPAAELITIAARPNQGKTWILLKMLISAWQQGKTVVLYSAEMSKDKIGYRFDTLLGNFSNKDLNRGISTPKYESFIEDLKNNKVPFIVYTPKDLGHRATVSDIEAMITNHGADIVGIDQFSLMDDETANRTKPRAAQLFTISESLMRLSEDYEVPILGVSQINRSGQLSREDTEEINDLSHLAESDGIGQNSSKVFTIRQTGAGLQIALIKNRSGDVNIKLLYYWDINNGTYRYIPQRADSAKPETREEQQRKNKSKYKDRKEAF